MLDAELSMRDHIYRSNFVVADSRYDVLLGMPWHKSESSRIYYAKPTVCVNEEHLPLSAEAHDNVVVSNLGVKKFRLLLRKKEDGNLKVFQTIEKPVEQQVAITSSDSEVQNLLYRFRYAFRDTLPARLPPERSVDHAIEINENARPPLRLLHQLSPAELLIVKEYVIDLLRKGKIRRRKSPCGASLFLVKEKDKRAVVDYRALNRLTKRNESPLPRPDEMFDRLASTRYFSKLDLKTGLHEIRVQAENIEKIAFKNQLRTV